MKAIFALLLLTVPALAEWDGVASPELREWFNSLRQPDNGSSCCGDSDLYYADAVEVRDSSVVATITDSRGHAIPEGTQIVIPRAKMNRDPNMTGHTLLFIGGSASSFSVYCFIPSTGV